MNTFGFVTGGASLKSYEHVFKFDHGAYHENKFIYQNNVIVKQCAETLENYLFSDLFVVGSSAYFDEFQTQVMVPFFEQVLQQVILCGFAAVKISSRKERDSEEKTPIPLAANLDYIQVFLTFNSNKMTYKFTVLDIHSQKLRKDIKIVPFANFCDLANESMCHSPLTFIRDLFYTNRFRQQVQIQGEFNACNPGVYLQPGEDGDKKSILTYSTGRQDSIRNATISPLEALRSDNIFDDRARIREQERLLDNQAFHDKQVETMVNIYNRNTMTQDRVFVPPWYGNIFITPDKMKLVGTPAAPRVGYDFIPQSDFLASQIYIAFGIPEAILATSAGGKTKSHQTKISSVNVDVFEKTLDSYKRFFADLYREVYADMFGVPGKFKVAFSKTQLDIGDFVEDV